MLEKFVSGFGRCVCSTVRVKFPSGAGFTSQDVLNSVIVLQNEYTPNNEMRYVHRKDRRGIDFWYDIKLRKLHIVIQYSRVDADEGIVFSFYDSAPLETGAREYQQVQNEVSRIIAAMVGQCFEAHNCFFDVVGTVGNDYVSCNVVKQDENTNDTYCVRSAFNFHNEFVLIKIKEYLNL